MFAAFPDNCAVRNVGESHMRCPTPAESEFVKHVPPVITGRRIMPYVNRCGLGSDTHQAAQAQASCDEPAMQPSWLVSALLPSLFSITLIRGGATSTPDSSAHVVLR